MRIFIAAAAVLALAGCAAPGPELPPLEFTAVHEAPGKSKQQICSAARDWAALTFKDSKAVVEVFDAEQGKMIGKGRVPIYTMSTSPMSADFTMLVECREGRFKTSFSDVALHHQGTSFPMTDNPVLSNPRRQADAHLVRLDAALDAYVKNPKTGGDW